MMIDRVRALCAIVLIAGCVPDFQLDGRQFAGEDAGSASDVRKPEEDAAPADAAPADADPADAAPVDAATVDAAPVDAAPIDADPVDADPDDADPDAQPVDAGPDCTADCTPPECAGFVFDNGQIRWQCVGGQRVEANCDNNLDDDGDLQIDCNDEPECGCTLGLLCCPNGNCLALPDVCE